MTRREVRAGRPRRSRTPGRRVLVYCGAACTEPDYFNGLRLKFPGVAVKVRAEGGKSPYEAVKAAAGYAQRFPDDFDDVWCVVDVDSFDLGDARTEAARAGVRLAVSSPCFELWLLLHFCHRSTAAQDARELMTQLKKHVPRYDKAKLCFEDFAAGIAEAGNRAQRLDNEATEADPYPNPSSGVWKLVASITGPNGPAG